MLLAGCSGDVSAATRTESGSLVAASPSASAPGASSSTAPTPTPESADRAAAAPSSALALLGTLDVKGRAPRTGYDRDLFGQRWADIDRNGCDTRNDMLRRDLTAVELKPGTNGCLVLTGSLADPFSGNTIDFTRGQDTSADVQIDHVVALSDAWQKGAQAWTSERRLAFGNDPLNLLAVDGGLNAQKGNGDAATWLPPNRPFRCAYVARQVAVKAKYGAWVTAAERDAIVRVLTTCPDEPVPASDSLPDATIAEPSPPPAPAPVPVPPPAGSCDPSYPGVCIPAFSAAGGLDCGDVDPRRFEVLAPDPHGFDGDHDGVGCES